MMFVLSSQWSEGSPSPSQEAGDKGESIGTALWQARTNLKFRKSGNVPSSLHKGSRSQLRKEHEAALRVPASHGDSPAAAALRTVS